MCRESSQILLSHREAQRGSPDQHFVLGVKLFNSLSLNLFTNYLVRGNTYQLPVSANKPPARFLSFLEDYRDPTKKKSVNALYKVEDMKTGGHDLAKQSMCFHYILFSPSHYFHVYFIAFGNRLY